jgi:hypothetical protein
MTPYDLTEDEEQQFSRKLEFYLRSTGHLFPVTPAQVKAFGQYMATHPDHNPPSKIQLTAEEILQRGYVEYVPKAKPAPGEEVYGDNFRAAARNKGHLTEDILRQMKEDQEKGKKGRGSDGMSGR